MNTIPKQITQERILKALEKARHYKYKSNDLNRKRYQEKYLSREIKVYAIQEKYGITGIELRDVKLGEIALQYYSQDIWLKTLDTDLKILESECIKIARKFCNAVCKYNMTLWKMGEGEEDWFQIDDWKIILSGDFPRQLAICWTEEYCVNQEKIKAKGHDFDKLYSSRKDIEWEFHLVLANFSYPNKHSDSVWFCANLGDTEPSL